MSSMRACLLFLCVWLLAPLGIAWAQTSTPYPSKSVYQSKSIQPDFDTWGSVSATNWNANLDNLAGNQAGGAAVNFYWIAWEGSNHSTCATSETAFQGHCYLVDAATDKFVQQATSRGLAITGVFFGTPNWANADKSCASSVWCSPNNAADFARFVRFVAHRYNGGTNGRVVDFVIHNEVNEQSWYNCGCNGYAAWQQDYANNFNAAYDGVKAEQSGARVLISLDHVWSPAHANAQTQAVSQFLPAVASLIGNRSWQVAFHPYSTTVGGTTFSPDDINAGYITFGDIGVLVAWLQKNYPGTAAASAIELTESGFDSANGAESAQNAALCSSFQNVVGTPGIDNYVYHRLVDNTGEGGLLLGLLRTDASQKPSWSTWALSNRSGYYGCGFSANDVTTLVRSYNSSRGHWASSRLAPSGFTTEHRFALSRSQLPSTVTLYECQVGQHNMLSGDIGCESAGFTNLGPVGYISTVQSSGLIAIYRCHLGNAADHFISTDPGCEGGVQDSRLGYAQQLN